MTIEVESNSYYERRDANYSKHVSIVAIQATQNTLTARKLRKMGKITKHLQKGPQNGAKVSE